MKKLILEEEDIQVQEEEAPDVVEGDDLIISNLISSLIKTTWNSIDDFNGAMFTLNELNNQKLIDTINDIINNLYVNIGQLENVLQDINVQAKAIDSELGDEIVPDDGEEIE